MRASGGAWLPAEGAQLGKWAPGRYLEGNEDERQELIQTREPREGAGKGVAGAAEDSGGDA
jgi:hypothetical protein